MRLLRQLGRTLAIVVASLVIVVSLAAIAGSWWLNSTLSNLTNQMFFVVTSAVAVADAGVARADGLVSDGRAEVQNATNTVETVGANIQANNPVLTALSDRVGSRLGPTVQLIQSTLEPVTGALRTADQVLSVLATVGLINEDTPRLLRTQETVSGITQLVADVQQIHSTLQAMAKGQADQLTGEAVAVLTGLTGRVDTRLGDLQASIQGVRSDIAALKIHLAERQARLLRIFNMTALALTLLFLWVIYSQFVVIRYQWRGLRTSDASGAATLLPAETAPAVPVE